MTTALYIATFIAGTFIGFLAAAMLAVGKRADGYEPVEHEPPFEGIEVEDYKR